jgi:hypothetical protein
MELQQLPVQQVYKALDTSYMYYYFFCFVNKTEKNTTLHKLLENISFHKKSFYITFNFITIYSLFRGHPHRV